MKVKLKVVQGKLKGKHGESAGLEVAISRPRFVIGTASDCHMRCPSSVISPHHCEITLDRGEVQVRDLASETGTYVNDQRLAPEQIVRDGDRLRVGRLEFEIAIEQSAGTRTADPVDEFVSDLLVHADEQERVTRMSDPELRQFHLEPSESESEADEPEELDKLERLRKKLPEKKPPGKLPPPPKITAESSVSAAEETLQKIFEKPKPKRPNF